MTSDRHGAPPRAPRDLILEAYALKAGQYVTVRTLAPGATGHMGSTVVAMSHTVDGTVVDATTAVLILGEGGTHHRFPWPAIADVVTYATTPAHPGL